MEFQKIMIRKKKNLDLESPRETTRVEMISGPLYSILHILTIKQSQCENRWLNKNTMEVKSEKVEQEHNKLGCFKHNEVKRGGGRIHNHNKKKQNEKVFLKTGQCFQPVSS